LLPQTTLTMISTAPLAVGLHSPDSVPVTWIALVIVEPGLAGIPVTDVMVIEQALTNSSRWRAIGFRKTYAA
jgi:hypothetical protein